jgi:MFS family permease
MASDYWGEFRTHWRPLLAATLGLGFGVGINAYIAGLFGPRLLSEFGWDRSQFALLGMIGLVMLVLSPVVGRLTDRYGVRAVAFSGVLGFSLALSIFALMTGDIRWFFGLNLLQILLGATTTTPVYSRLVAERFVTARGFAFSIVMTGPPLAGAIMAPIIGHVIEAEGWRAGYLVLSGAALVFGLLAVLLMPAHTPSPVHGDKAARDAGEAAAEGMRRADRGRILAHPAFWIIIAGMVLANVPHALLSSQMKLMLMDSGASAQVAVWLVSAFAAGVIIGRFLCGLALDRAPAHVVAAVALALPALGMVLLASPFDGSVTLALSVMLLGLAYGAEGDIAAYLVSRHFEVRVFSTVMGFVGAAIAGGSAGGALLLSMTLRNGHGYGPYLLIGATSTLVGAVLFFTLGRLDPRRDGGGKA